MNATEFKAHLEGIKTYLADKENQTVRAVCIDVLDQLAGNTPVKTGRLRANWNMGIGSPDRSVVEFEGGESAAEQVIEQKKSKAGDIKAGDTIFFSNNVHYGRTVNDGHGNREGVHFVELAIANVAGGLRP